MLYKHAHNQYFIVMHHAPCTFLHSTVIVGLMPYSHVPFLHVIQYYVVMHFCTHSTF